MKPKPTKCCPMGSYECTVPMPVDGKVVEIDLCIAPLVAKLNAAGLKTVSSCCGHGEIPGCITLEDDTTLYLGAGLEQIVSIARRVHMSRDGSDYSAIECDRDWYEALIEASKSAVLS